jgi:hypothetical protein
VVTGVEGIERFELETVQRERVPADDLGPRGGINGDHVRQSVN